MTMLLRVKGRWKGSKAYLEEEKMHSIGPNKMMKYCKGLCKVSNGVTTKDFEWR